MPIHNLVQFAKAVADPTRARILAMLSGGELCVCEIVDVLDLPQSTLSTHLQTLRQAGVVKVTKRSTWAYYSLEEGFRPLLAELVAHFDLAGDPATQTMRDRLNARLAMRECDCCVRGTGQLIQIGGKP